MERLANKGEEETMSVAKEMGLEFTSEELREAASVKELSLDEMESAAGGTRYKRTLNNDKDKTCPANPDGHNWVYYGRIEDPCLGWLKKGGLWTVGFDCYHCTYCGKGKKIHT